jgi:hypothetical protein
LPERHRKNKIYLFVPASAILPGRAALSAGPALVPADSFC